MKRVLVGLVGLVLVLGAGCGGMSGTYAEDYDVYNAEIYDVDSEMPEIILQEEIPESDTVRHLYVIQLDLDKLSPENIVVVVG